MTAMTLVPIEFLEGTTNFLHGIPQFAISIGLRREDTIVAGVIYNSANDQLYIAEPGARSRTSAARTIR